MFYLVRNTCSTINIKNAHDNSIIENFIVCGQHNDSYVCGVAVSPGH